MLIWSTTNWFTPADGLTPGTSIASAYVFRPSNGNSVTCLLCTTCPVVDESVSSTILCACTSIRSLTCPICNVKSSRATCCTTNCTSVCRIDWNPDLLTPTE